jgi:hypothetical protein
MRVSGGAAIGGPGSGAGAVQRPEGVFVLALRRRKFRGHPPRTNRVRAFGLGPVGRRSPPRWISPQQDARVKRFPDVIDLRRPPRSTPPAPAATSSKSVRFRDGIHLSRNDAGGQRAGHSPARSSKRLPLGQRRYGRSSSFRRVLSTRRRLPAASAGVTRACVQWRSGKDAHPDFFRSKGRHRQVLGVVRLRSPSSGRYRALMARSTMHEEAELVRQQQFGWLMLPGFLDLLFHLSGSWSARSASPMRRPGYQNLVKFHFTASPIIPELLLEQLEDRMRPGPLNFDLRHEREGHSEVPRQNDAISPSLPAPGGRTGRRKPRTTRPLSLYFW